MIDLSISGNYLCPDWVDNPISVWAATGGLLGKIPIICGGYSDASGSGIDECHSINKGNVEFFGKLLTKRVDAASVTLNDTYIWITGGKVYDENLRNSTELVSKEGITQLGPELPIHLEDHAMINTKSNLTMFIGGSSSAAAQTFYYNHADEAWLNGPSLNQGRRDHAVGIVTDEITNENLVIVTGGRYHDNGVIFLKSTEILKDDKWIKGERPEC